MTYPALKYRWIGIALVLILSGPSTIAQAPSSKTVTLLFTNDFESAYEPVTAFWRDDLQRIGGVAELGTLIQQLRKTEPHVFLLDAGDIFTGTLAKLTRGEIAFELMLTMGYDAMSIGNHEFEYGWKVLEQQKHRVPFPVLAANLFYRDTNHPFAQPYTILERGDIRIGVIGVMGQDAATALIPANIAGLDVRDPISCVRFWVERIADQVDLVVVLTHQGPTAPMQTDDEADEQVQRGNQANLALAAAVPDIDVIFAGHTDAGTRSPLIEPTNGTLIMQTYGQGQHLGFLQITLDSVTGEQLQAEGKLIAVNADELTPDPKLVAKLDAYRAQFPDLYLPIGELKTPLVRRYYQESGLGNAFADIVRHAANAEIGLMPSGALRKDLAAGPIRKVDLLDSFPFEDRVAQMSLRGKTLAALIEQGLSLERGMLQVSGLKVHYNPDQPIGERLVSAAVNGQPLELDRTYRVGTVEILAKGGDSYIAAKQAESVTLQPQTFAQALLHHFSGNVVVAPASDRLIPVPPTAQLP